MKSLSQRVVEYNYMTRIIALTVALLDNKDHGRLQCAIVTAYQETML